MEVSYTVGYRDVRFLSPLYSIFTYVVNILHCIEVTLRCEVTSMHTLRSIIHCPGLFSRNTRFWCCLALILTVPEAEEG